MWDRVRGQAALPLRRGEPADPHHCPRENWGLPGGELLHALFPVRDRWDISGAGTHIFCTQHSVPVFVLISLSSFAFPRDSETWQGEDQQSQHYDDRVELPELLEQSLLLLPPHFPDCTAQKTMQKVWRPMRCHESHKGRRTLLIFQ